MKAEELEMEEGEAPMDYPTNIDSQSQVAPV